MSRVDHSRWSLRLKDDFRKHLGKFDLPFSQDGRTYETYQGLARIVLESDHGAPFSNEEQVKIADEIISIMTQSDYNVAVKRSNGLETRLIMLAVSFLNNDVALMKLVEYLKCDDVKRDKYRGNLAMVIFESILGRSNR